MNTYRRFIIALAACLLPAGLLHAEPSSNVAWTVKTYSMVKKADPNIGRDLEKVETEDVLACTGCHGAGGAQPDRDKHPVLAGQIAAYTFKQLKDYKDGTRDNRRMNEAVERLTDEQLAALAAWYSRQPPASVEVDAEETVSEETLQLVFRGDKTRLIQPCASCHGRWGRGAVIDVPAIAGQNVKYFVETMKDYARDKRANDLYSRMRIIAKALTRDEIDELAVYYANLGNERSGPGPKQAGAN